MLQYHERTILTFITEIPAGYTSAHKEKGGKKEKIKIKKLPACLAGADMIIYDRELLLLTDLM